MTAVASPNSWGWRVAGFGGIFSFLQQTYGSAKASVVEHWVIDVATVKTSAALIGAIWPAIGVHAEGPRLASPGGSVNVLNGCEGTDVAFLLVAAMLVAPMPCSRRFSGLALGLALVFVLNQARLVALFHAFRYDPALFGWLHSTVGPLVLVTLVGLFFAGWLNRSSHPGVVRGGAA